MQAPCPLCLRQSNWDKSFPPVPIITCVSCGEYRVSSIAIEDDLAIMRRREQETDLIAISAFTRQETEKRKRSKGRQSNMPVLVGSLSVVLDSEKTPEMFGIDDLINDTPRTVNGQLEKLLLSLGDMSDYPGAWVEIREEDAPIAYAINSEAFAFMLKQIEAKGLIYAGRGITFPGKVQLTASGWDRVSELERGRAGEKPLQAFVAMWFDASMEEAHVSGLTAGIKDAGYEPLRIDAKAHNNKIDDEIIAEIRKSKFVVADFTGQRGGVYYEAGFAHGLGLPVIWTCREDEISKCHFDTRQYNHITWKTPEELRDKLRARIEATIGRPPAPA